jgi:hypothetical protein
MSSDSERGLEFECDSAISFLSEFLEGDRAFDNLALKATGAFRVKTVPEERWKEVADLMRKEIFKISDSYGFSEKICRDVFSQAVLVLGSYGNEKDVPLLLNLINRDRVECGDYDPVGRRVSVRGDSVFYPAPPKVRQTHRFSPFLTEGLKRILMCNAERISDDSAGDVRNVCEGIFNDFNESMVSNCCKPNFNVVDKCCDGLRPLTARLEPLDLDLGLTYAQKFQRSFSGIMQYEIKSTRERLNKIGKGKWVKDREEYTDKILGELEALSKQED